MPARGINRTNYFSKYSTQHLEKIYTSFIIPHFVADGGTKQIRSIDDTTKDTSNGLKYKHPVFLNPLFNYSTFPVLMSDSFSSIQMFLAP